MANADIVRGTILAVKSTAQLHLGLLKSELEFLVRHDAVDDDLRTELAPLVSIAGLDRRAQEDHGSQHADEQNEDLDREQTPYTSDLLSTIRLGTKMGVVPRPLRVRVDMPVTCPDTASVIFPPDELFVCGWSGHMAYVLNRSKRSAVKIDASRLILDEQEETLGSDLMVGGGDNSSASTSDMLTWSPGALVRVFLWDNVRTISGVGTNLATNQFGRFITTVHGLTLQEQVPKNEGAQIYQRRD